jgi:hypothetical protein
MRDYPLPACAVSIWLVGDRLMIGVPPVGDERASTKVIPLDRCHVVKNSSSQTGWQFILNLLRDRAQMARENQKSTIGSKGDPVQYDIDEMLKLMRRSTVKPQKVGELTLEDLGL